MKKEDHLKKSVRIEDSIAKLDREHDWELIVEGCYGAAQHYIAYLCEVRLHVHRETHKGLVKFLREHSQEELAHLFQQLDELRLGRWYGNQVNGETVDLALLALGKIKSFLEHAEEHPNTPQ